MDEQFMDEQAWIDKYVKGNLDYGNPALNKYLKFLDENEALANKLGITLKKLKEEAPSLDPKTINSKMITVQNQLKRLEVNCNKFDELMQYLDECEPKVQLYGRTLSTFKAKLAKKRGVLTGEDIRKIRSNLFKEMSARNTEREEKIKVLKNKLAERKISIDEYLQSRFKTIYTVSTKDINEYMIGLELLDRIEKQLLAANITMDELLNSIDSSELDIKANQLAAIAKAIEFLKTNNRPLNIRSIDLFYNARLEEAKKNKKR